MGKKHRQYSDEFRANAVVLLESSGYPEQVGALTRVADHLKMPYQTLSRWYNAKNNPPPPELVQVKRKELIDIIRDEVYKAIGAADGARDEASYRDLITAAAIMVDKLQLLTGKATERTEVLSDGLTDEQRANRIAAIFDKARTRRSGFVDSGSPAELVRH
jgi:transposase-like protein